MIGAYMDLEKIKNDCLGFIKECGLELYSLTYEASEQARTTDWREGRNDVQNDQLTLKTAGSKDLWFHTKDIPGTHVILFTEGKTPSEESLAQAASIAAYYSKGKMSSNVPVDCCPVKYVRKPAGAKPGKVIFDHNRTLYVDPALPPENPSSGSEK